MGKNIAPLKFKMADIARMRNLNAYNFRFC